jgi:hypothetical protein
LQQVPKLNFDCTAGLLTIKSSQQDHLVIFRQIFYLYFLVKFMISMRYIHMEQILQTHGTKNLHVRNKII